jgi:hypothetical protein
VSPVKRASAVAALQRAAGPPPESPGHREVSAAVAAVPQDRKARVTLNLEPAMYRQLTRWADEAADAIGVPRVGVQDALRAMITVLTDRPATDAAEVLAALREARG